MNIGMIHFRVGATDGVSLEMHKWKTVLEKMGHQVFYIAAEENQAHALLIPEMSILTETHRKLFRNCYVSLTDYQSTDALHDDIIQIASVIESKLSAYIDQYQLDLLIPNNVSSLGLNLPTGLAIGNVIKHKRIKTLFHHHDFFWERERYSHPTASFILDYLQTYFPFHDDDLTAHVVINHLAKEELFKRRGLQAHVIPNVFDFKEPLWHKSNESHTLKQLLGINDTDLVILQATRIEDRKAIELALDVTHELYRRKHHMVGQLLYDNRVFHEHSNIHFIIAGLNEMRPDLYQLLEKKIKSMPFKTHLIHDIVGSKRSDNPRKFALWDVYTIADAITYPSILEGWGNQFLEGLFAKKPIVIYEYPVYISDIKPLGFDVISLGHTYTKDTLGYIHVDDQLIKQAASKLMHQLTSQNTYRKVVEHNFKLGSTHLSYDALSKHLKSILSNI